MKACGIVLYRRNENDSIEYLLMQTSYGEHHWTPPKGFCETNESELETAIRETKEESGLSINSDYFLVDEQFKIEIKYFVKSREKTVIYWLGKVNDLTTKVIMSEEHQDFAWLPLDEACQLAKYKEMVNVLHKCDEYIRVNAK